MEENLKPDEMMVSRLAPSVYRIAYNCFGCREDAEDIVTYSSLFYERKNKENGAAQQYSDNYSDNDFYDGYSNIYWHLDEVIDTSSIKTVIIDGVTYDVNK